MDPTIMPILTIHQMQGCGVRIDRIDATAALKRNPHTMSILKKWLGAKQPAGEFALMQAGKIVYHPHLLPKQFPALYAEPPKDRFALRTELLADAEAIVRDLVFDFHLPPDVFVDAILHNIRLLLDIPEVYTLLVNLKKQNLDKFYQNQYALSALHQICVFHTPANKTENLRRSMMTTQLGIFLRYYGIRWLDQEKKRILGMTRQFDITNARQKDMRDKFLVQYRQVMNKLAHLSADRLHQMLETTHRAEPYDYTVLLHVIRFSTRLMGRTAEKFSPDEQRNIHTLAGYVAVLFSFASGWIGAGKRTCHVLAELWGRSRLHYRNKDLGMTAIYNPAALNDLFRIADCHVLSNFQGKHIDAIYAPRDSLLVKEEPILVELKPGSRQSVRRYIAGPELQSDTEVNDPITDEELAASPPVPETATQTSWQLYRCNSKLDVRARTLMQVIETDRDPSEDPSDKDLVPC